MTPFLLLAAATGQGFGERHAFGIADWVAMRYDAPRAVSPDGAWILYSVAHGAQTGNTVIEWRLIHPDGSGMKPVEMPNGFQPAGFTPDSKLYGVIRAGGGTEIGFFGLDNLSKGAKPDREFRCRE